MSSLRADALLEKEGLPRRRHDRGLRRPRHGAIRHRDSSAQLSRLDRAVLEAAAVLARNIRPELPMRHDGV